MAAYKCKDCGKEGDTKLVHLGNNLLFTTRLCPRCVAKHHAFKCVICKKTKIGDGVPSRSGQIVCSGCRPSVYYCEKCGSWFPKELFKNFDGSHFYCPACIKSMRIKVGIKSYGYKPLPKFQKVGNEEELFIGMELEVTSQRNPRQSVMQTLHDEVNDDSFEKHIYFKEDCSLSSGGIEIVTQPLTPEYYAKHNIMERISNVLIRYHVTSHDSRCCGMHFHVNRSYFGNNSAAVQDCINRIAAWIYRYRDEIKTISRRNSNNLDAWARIYSYTYSRSENYRGGRGALNCQNSNTIEFRFFRGNTRLDRLQQSLHVIERICKLAKHGALAELMAVTPTTLYNEITPKE